MTSASTLLPWESQSFKSSYRTGSTVTSSTYSMTKLGIETPVGVTYIILGALYVMFGFRRSKWVIVPAILAGLPSCFLLVGLLLETGFRANAEPGIYVGACFSIVAAFLARTKGTKKREMEGSRKRNPDAGPTESPELSSAQKLESKILPATPSNLSHSILFQVLSRRPIPLSDGSSAYSKLDLESHADLRALHRRAIDMLHPIREDQAAQIFRIIGVASPIKFVGSQLDKVFTNIRSIALSGSVSGICYSLSHEPASEEPTVLYIHHVDHSDYASGLAICRLTDGAVLAYNDARIGSKLGIKVEQQIPEFESELEVPALLAQQAVSPRWRIDAGDAVRKLAVLGSCIQADWDCVLCIPDQPPADYSLVGVRGRVTCHQCGYVIPFSAEYRWDAGGGKHVSCEKCISVTAISGEFEFNRKPALLVIAFPFTQLEPARRNRTTGLVVEELTKE